MCLLATVVKILKTASKIESIQLYALYHESNNLLLRKLCFTIYIIKLNQLNLNQLPLKLERINVEASNSWYNCESSIKF